MKIPLRSGAPAEMSHIGRQRGQAQRWTMILLVLVLAVAAIGVATLTVLSWTDRCEALQNYQAFKPHESCGPKNIDCPMYGQSCASHQIAAVNSKPICQIGATFSQASSPSGLSQSHARALPRPLSPPLSPSFYFVPCTRFMPRV